jgi:hypothetical protein
VERCRVVRVLSLDVPDLKDAHAVRDLIETTLAECIEEYGVAPTLILHDTPACSMSKDENLA